MTTMQDTVDETRRLLHGGMQDLLDVLSSSIDSDAATINLTDGIKGVGRGSVLEIGLEQMYVRSVSNLAVTVIRGHNGTTATDHAADSLVVINPSYPTDNIFRACVDEIGSLRGSGLYQFNTVEFTLNRRDQVYPLDTTSLTGEPLFLHSAMYQGSGTYSSWWPISMELVKDLDSTEFPSTYGIKFKDHIRHLNMTATVTVRATVAFTLGLPTAIDDTLSEAENGIGDHISSIIPVGAAWRMILGKEARRANPDHNHGSRRAEEIQPGSAAFLGRAFLSMKEDLVADAIEHQIKKYSYRTEM